MKTPLKLCLAALSAALLLTGCSSVSPDGSSSGGTAPVSSAAQQPVSCKYADKVFKGVA